MPNTRNTINTTPRWPPTSSILLVTPLRRATALGIPGGGGFFSRITGGAGQGGALCRRHGAPPCRLGSQAHRFRPLWPAVEGLGGICVSSSWERCEATTSPSMTRSHLQPHRTTGPAPEAAPITLDTAHV
ncbi:unnamed protein product [Arctogadus glacialis]